MKKTLAYALTACALIAGATLFQRASAQEATAYPGQATRANVWIQNRSDAEAVPVSLERVSPDSTLRVELAGVPAVTIDPRSITQSRAARQSWEYRAVTIAAGQNPVTAFNNAGADGWETTGLAFPAPGGTLVILKRPN
jgi:hypothetical protein